jgi:Tfp pilus assembly protein FimT
MINSKRLIHLSVTDKTPIIKQQIGFTPIILVIVITLLRILSTVAVPRFIDLSEEAHRSAVSGTAGSFAIGLMLIRSDAVMQLCSYAVMQNILPHTSMLINGRNVVNQDLKPHDDTAG